MLKGVLLLFLVAACYGCRRQTSVNCPHIGTFHKAGPYARWKLPKCPDDIGFQMLLYTRSNLNSGKVTTITQLSNVFRLRARTIFLIHGYKKANEWFGRMKNMLLAKGNFNVITVDWDSNGRYSKAASNTRTIGASVGLMAQLLVAHKHISRSHLWCIGHSLGAHTCGVAGKRYRFARITGLDPAGPSYRFNIAAGLTRRSADFVDIIHTGAIYLGLFGPVGHVDFYPNGGRRQPGCPPSIIGWKCNHRRAIDIFIDSINGRSRCYTNLKCATVIGVPITCVPTTRIQQMGYNSEYKSGRGIFFLAAGPRSPYC